MRLKACIQCGDKIPRNQYDSKKRYMGKKYCSALCATRGTTEHRGEAVRAAALRRREAESRKAAIDGENLRLWFISRRRATYNESLEEIIGRT